ncbi:unnamed protein product [Euphydryas editha]|uniref:Transposase n=1 Tax=Euphydryas editha TaxID=104508 RepID=A0AAU9TDS2_EUPED|nr:unnamed protein product [Euphydryas editha]
MNAYKIQSVQELEPYDHPMHFRFAQCAEDRLIKDEHYYRKIFFLDEAHFHLGGYVTKQNCHIIWGSENPHVIVEKSMHPQRVTFWCLLTLLSHFSWKMSKKMPLNNNRYRAMISDFLSQH